MYNYRHDQMFCSVSITMTRANDQGKQPEIHGFALK